MDRELRETSTEQVQKAAFARGPAIPRIGSNIGDCPFGQITARGGAFRWLKRRIELWRLTAQVPRESLGEQIDPRDVVHSAETLHVVHIVGRKRAALAHFAACVAMR